MQKAPFSTIIKLVENTEKPNIELGLNIAKHHYREEFDEYFGCSVEEYEKDYLLFLEYFEDIDRLEITNLDLGNKNLKTIPKFVFSLGNLERLNIAVNHIQSIPKEIKKLKNLRYFYAQSNQLQAVPAEIGELENLVYLNSDNNQLQTIAAEI